MTDVQQWSYRDEHGRTVIDIDAAFDACDLARDEYEAQVAENLRIGGGLIMIKTDEGDER